MWVSVSRALSARLGAWQQVLRRGEPSHVLPPWSELPPGAVIGRRVVLTDSLGRALEGALAPAEGRGPPQGQAELRRVLRLSQADASLSPSMAAAWLEGPAESAARALGEALGQLLDGLGRWPGGELTARLGGAALVELAARRGEAQLGVRAWSAELFRLGVEWAIEARAPEGGVALGRAWALLANPLATGAELDAATSSPLNPYRTIPAALRFARRVLEPPLEGVPLARVVGAISDRLLVEEDVRALLAEELRRERIREAALAAWARGEAPASLHEVLASPRELLAFVGVPHRQSELRKRAAASGARTLATIVRALDEPPSDEAVEERARLAASGGVLAWLDAGLATQLRERFDGADLSDDPEAWQRGQVVRLGEPGEAAVKPPAGAPAWAVSLEPRPADLGGADGARDWALVRDELLEPGHRSALSRSAPGWLEVVGTPGRGLEARGHPEVVFALVRDWLAQVGRLWSRLEERHAVARSIASQSPEAELAAGRRVGPGAPAPLRVPVVVGLAADVAGSDLGLARARQAARRVVPGRGDRVEMKLGAELGATLSAFHGLAGLREGPEGWIVVSGASDEVDEGASRSSPGG